MSFYQEYKGKRLVVRAANYMYSGELAGIDSLNGTVDGPQFMFLKDPRKIFDIDEGAQKVMNEESKPLPNPTLIAIDSIETVYPAGEGL